jgi:hypothetical protein
MLTTFLATGSALAEGDKTKYLFSTKESPYRLPYVQWMQKWWSWIANFTHSNNPNDHYTPEKCQINQIYSENVWFLSIPSPEESSWQRTCNVPKQLAVLLPIVTGECDTGDTNAPLDCAKRGDEGARITVSIDGNKFNYDMIDDRSTSGLFNISWTKDNFFESKPGVFQGAVDGYFLFLKPLSPGNHEVSFEADVLPPNNPEEGYHQKGTYFLNIG